MQYITIKQEEKNNQTVFTVNAILLQNKNKTVAQKIPHPLGTDIMEFSTLDDAKEAISRAGFDYILPDGTKMTFSKPKKSASRLSNDYEDIIYSAIKSKIESQSSRVSASAILALAEFPKEETFEILFAALGEENDIIRKNAISGICRYGNILQDKIINALNSENWITRNSALTCITNLAENPEIQWENFISPLVKATEDSNPIVQSNAISTLTIVYRSFKKYKKV